MNAKSLKVLKYLLSVAVAAGLLYFAFRGTDWKAFLDGLRETRWLFIVLSVAASVIALVLRARRWKGMLLPLDGSISGNNIWHASNVGNFLNVAIPGIGEFYRCGRVSTKKSPYDRTFGTILMERAWDVIWIAALLALAVLCGKNTLAPFVREHVLDPLASRLNFSMWWCAAAVLLLAAALVGTAFAFEGKNGVCKKAAGLIKGVALGLAAFSKMQGKVLFLARSAGIWLMYICVTWLTFLAVPGLEHLSFADALFISAIGNIASVIPTPGNVGPYHYLVGLSISTIYLGSTVMASPALLCATLSHGVHAIIVIILGLISYFVNVSDNSKGLH